VWKFDRFARSVNAMAELESSFKWPFGTAPVGAVCGTVERRLDKRVGMG
jgi:hypothetical protein